MGEETASWSLCSHRTTWHARVWFAPPGTSCSCSEPLSAFQACAHRWKNIYYETDHILPHGFCYVIPSNLQAKGRTLIPCYEGERS